MDDDLIISTSDKPRTVRDCLEEARRATSPAKTVEHLFLAVSYQQQQIEQLEIALGLIGTTHGQKAHQGIEVRAKKTLAQAGLL